MKIATFGEFKNDEPIFDVVQFDEDDAKTIRGFRIADDNSVEPYPTLCITKYKVVRQISADEVPVENRMDCGVTLLRGAMASTTFTCFRMEM